MKGEGMGEVRCCIPVGQGEREKVSWLPPLVLLGGMKSLVVVSNWTERVTTDLFSWLRVK
jgi:hypothetical protein